MRHGLKQLGRRLLLAFGRGSRQVECKCHDWFCEWQAARRGVLMIIRSRTCACRSAACVDRARARIQQCLRSKLQIAGRSGASGH